MAELLNVCRFTSGSSGTWSFTDGTAIQGFLNLSGAGAVNGATYPYRAENATRTEWEIGYGVYNSGTGVLSRTPLKSSNSDLTVNFATAPVVLITPLASDIATTVPPSFIANKNGTNQSVASATDTKITFTNEVYDEGGYYDAVNSKWVPPAGRYVIGAQLIISSGAVDQNECSCSIYKNGTRVAHGYEAASGTLAQGVTVNTVVEANGTDYFEVWTWCGGAGSKTVSGTVAQSFFWGHSIEYATANVMVSPDFPAFDSPRNVSLGASVGAGALTVSVLGADAQALSVDNAAAFVFRSATASNGAPVRRTVDTALSLVVSSGSTLGAIANVPFRLWIVAFDDAGTIRIGVIQRITGGATPTAMAAVADNILASSTAEGGAGAADSAGVLYTGTAVTTKPYRILGYMDWDSGLATPGTWAIGPSRIQLFGPGVPSPGDAIQVVQAIDSQATSTSSATLVDTTLTVSISPTSAANLIEAKASGTLYNGTTNNAAGATLARGSTSIGNLADNFTGASAISPTTLQAIDAPGTTSATSYKVRLYKRSGTGSVGWNNGALQCCISAKEIMA